MKKLYIAQILRAESVVEDISVNEMEKSFTQEAMEASGEQIEKY